MYYWKSPIRHKTFPLFSTYSSDRNCWSSLVGHLLSITFKVSWEMKLFLPIFEREERSSSACFLTCFGGVRESWEAKNVSYLLYTCQKIRSSFLYFIKKFNTITLFGTWMQWIQFQKSLLHHVWCILHMCSKRDKLKGEVVFLTLPTSVSYWSKKSGKMVCSEFGDQVIF